MEKKNISWAWYLLPIFLSIVGGIIAWAITKKDDPKKAVSFLWVGGVVFVVNLLAVGFLTYIVMTSLGQAGDAAEEHNRSVAINQIRSSAEVYMAQSENLDYRDFYYTEGREMRDIIERYGVNDDFAGNFDDSNSEKVLRVNVRQADGDDFNYDEYCAHIKLSDEEYLCVDVDLAINRIDDYTSSGPCFEGDGEDIPLYSCP